MDEEAGRHVGDGAMRGTWRAERLESAAMAARMTGSRCTSYRRRGRSEEPRRGRTTRDEGVGGGVSHALPGRGMLAGRV